MGRRKIEITRIENDRHRQVTFAKRKLGVMKKATELSILCNANVAVIVFSANNKMSVYSNCPINSLVQRYMETRESAEVVTTVDYFREKAREALAIGDANDGELQSQAPAAGGTWPLTTTNSDGSFSVSAYTSRPFTQMSQGFSSQPNQSMPALQPSPMGQSSQEMHRQMLQLQQQQQLLQQQQLQQIQQQLQQQIQHEQEMQQLQQMQQQSPLAHGQQSQQMTQPLSSQPPPSHQQSYQSFLQAQQATVQAQGSQNNMQQQQQQQQFQSFPPYSSEHSSKPLGNGDSAQTPQQLQLQLQQLQQQQSLVQQQLESFQRQQHLQPSPTSMCPQSQASNTSLGSPLN